MDDKNSLNPDYNYHFDREEYENSRYSEPKLYKGGSFKNNKTLYITLLDIAIIVLIIIVVLPFVRKSYEIPNFKGYRLELIHYSSNNETFLNLSITNRSREESNGADLVDLEFYLENNTDSIFINDLLPLPGKTLTYRSSFKEDDSKIASVKVTIRGESKVLNVKLNTK